MKQYCNDPRHGTPCPLPCTACEEECEPIILVIFRKYKDGGVIALFVEEPATSNYDHCESYQHQGQHGAADPMHVISETKLATPDEYADLYAELETIGYNLKVIEKTYQRHREIRKGKLLKLAYSG